MDQEQLNGELYWAAMDGQTEEVEDYIKRGANVNYKGYWGQSPLFVASRDGHTETVARLVDLGADIEAKNNLGQSPLLVASYNGHTETVSRLVDLGADIEAKDRYGNTPYDVAKKDEIKELLKSYMSSKEDTTRKHHTVQDLLKELNELGLETVSEFKQMLRQGTYKCFWNRVYLVGPYGVGKTTLAKLLVEEEIPDTWNSTDGIFIYLGRAAMDTDSKKWVPLKKCSLIYSLYLNEPVKTISRSRTDIFILLLLMLLFLLL